MIKLKIDVKKIDKERLFVGDKGTYLDCVLFDKPDNYGNDGFVAQDVSKEEREAGEKGAIIGNWRTIGAKPAQKPPQKQSPPPARKPPVDPDLDAEGDDIPFSHEAHAPR